jgi:hypothetical protein
MGLVLSILASFSKNMTRLQAENALEDRFDPCSFVDFLCNLISFPNTVVAHRAAATAFLRCLTYLGFCLARRSPLQPTLRT